MLRVAECFRVRINLPETVLDQGRYSGMTWTQLGDDLVRGLRQTINNNLKRGQTHNLPWPYPGRDGT